MVYSYNRIRVKLARGTFTAPLERMLRDCREMRGTIFYNAHGQGYISDATGEANLNPQQARKADQFSDRLSNLEREIKSYMNDARELESYPGF